MLYVGGNPLIFIDPFGLFEITAHQERGGFSGWETHYEFAFNSNLNPNLINRWGRGAKKFVDQVKPDSVGPRRPIEDAIECATLDAELEKSYQEWFKHKDGDRLKREEAEQWLDAMRERHPEMNRLYGSNENMLNQAEVNSRNHWFYRMNPGK